MLTKVLVFDMLQLIPHTRKSRAGRVYRNPTLKRERIHAQNHDGIDTYMLESPRYNRRANTKRSAKMNNFRCQKSAYLKRAKARTKPDGR